MNGCLKRSSVGGTTINAKKIAADERQLNKSVPEGGEAKINGIINLSLFYKTTFADKLYTSVYGKSSVIKFLNENFMKKA
ncbi:MAG TPA: hypothetical protein VEX64_00830 [Pyrinomonadaceae bacterium]|nr:hypothetical protein [Pyrinomonadaceae bacterium]